MKDNLIFWWKGERSDDYGLLVQKQPPISRAKERVSTVTIPGRAGTLTLLQGDDVYDPVTKTVTCALSDSADLGAVVSWLRGSGFVRFGNDPDRQYEARIANQADFQHLFNNGWLHQAQIPFYCQPLKHSYPEPDDIVISASGTEIENIGNVTAKPTIMLTLSADAPTNEEGYAEDITFVIDDHNGQGKAVILTELHPGDKVVLDWNGGDCYFYETSENANNHVIGNPQVIPPGNATITWSGGISSCVIKPNWRWA